MVSKNHYSRLPKSPTDTRSLTQKRLKLRNAENDVICLTLINAHMDCSFWLPNFSTLHSFQSEHSARFGVFFLFWFRHMGSMCSSTKLFKHCSAAHEPKEAENISRRANILHPPPSPTPGTFL
uniref:Uncharacterized protein n=1 Tax=Eutreptiella gymnastica TaxID=73025 RepID=A0A7S1I170_9EUGL